jgi:isoleucyl-tRNA synthetase
VLTNILEVLVRVLAPILSFTCDEVWDYYPAGLSTPNRAGAIALAGWPEAADFVPQIPPAEASRIASEFALILDVREVVTKALEESGCKKSQQAALTITAPPATLEVLAAQEEHLLEELFIVSEVLLAPGEGAEISVEVREAAGEKCPRCWNYRELGSDPTYPEVCQRCAAVLTSLGA